MLSACSRVVVSCFALYSGSARDASGQAVFFVWQSTEDCVSRVVGYVFLCAKGKGNGVAAYDSFDLEAFA